MLHLWILAIPASPGQSDTCSRVHVSYLLTSTLGVAKVHRSMGCLDFCRNIEQFDSNPAGGKDCLWNQCLCSTQCCCLNGKWFNRKRQIQSQQQTQLGLIIWTAISDLSLAVREEEYLLLYRQTPEITYGNWTQETEHMNGRVNAFFSEKGCYCLHNWYQSSFGHSASQWESMWPNLALLPPAGRSSAGYSQSNWGWHPCLVEADILYHIMSGNRTIPTD